MVVRRVLDGVGEGLGGAVAAVRVGFGSGLVRPVRPDRLVGMARGFLRWGMSPAAAYAVGAARHPDRAAVVDERGTTSYDEVDRRSTVVAAALRERGVRPGDPVALLARNSAQFVIAQAAIGKVGGDVLYANTGFAGPQLGDVLEAERATAVIADEEFVALLDDVAPDLPRLLAWTDDPDAENSMSALVRSAGRDLPDVPSPGRDGRHVILTSGTTGRPKGAARSAPGLLAGLVEGVGLLEAIPYRAGGTTVLAAPAFHAWGLANLIVGSLLGSTLVMVRRFDPAGVHELLADNDADTLVAVPVMLQRMLEVPADDVPRPEHLALVAISGSALPPTLAERFMDRYGDVLHSLYGSTEVAYVAVASPRDLRAAPGTAGRVVRGVTVRIVDEDDEDVPPGETGRIFAASGLAFEGYTNGEDKARLGNLASTGDVGRLDADGRLWVEGRDDDMIVSGGENVFPAEVEDCLLQHPDVADAVVVGVEDEKFGQALVAHVVLRDGASCDEKALREHVKSRLANYKVPRAVSLHDELPRNETGKVLKRELAT